MAAEKNADQVALALLAHLRDVGPYEEWLARAHDVRGRLPRLVVARRAHPDRPDQADLNRRLAAASDVAQKVEHQNVVHCHGRVETGDLTAQLVEALDGLDLAAALDRSGPIDPALATWIARQIAEGVAHAHSLCEPHRGLNPEHVIVTRQGKVKVDFGLASENLTEQTALTNFVDLRYADTRWLTSPDNHPKLDAFAIASILWELVVSRRYTEALAAAGDVPYVPSRTRPELEAVLERALHRGQPPFDDARSLADALTRVFYAAFDGDDEQHGRQALARWVGEVGDREAVLFSKHRLRLPASAAFPTSCGSHRAPSRSGSLSTEIDKESFDRLIQELDQPVRPSEFTQDDVDLGSEKNEDGSWAPGMALKTKLALFRSEQQPTVGVPHVSALDGIAAQAAKPTERVDPSQFTSQPDAPLTMQPSASVPESLPIPAKPSRLLWFLAGFALTGSLLLLASLLTG